MLKKSPTDWLLARLTRSRNARRKSLSFKHDRQGAAPHVPSVVQELEDRVLLAAEIAVFGNGVEIIDGDTTRSALDETIFADTPVGGMSTQTFSIQNSGDTTLNIFSYGFGGYSGPGTLNDFNDSGLLPGSVAANGGAETVTVQFAPTAVGAASFTFDTSSDDADESTFDFVLMGTGVANTAPTITSGNSVSVAENFSGVVTTVTATDPDAPTFQTLSYSISGGADEFSFSIDSASGELTFKNFRSIDFENPTDTGGTPGDNIYEVIVQVTDGTTPVMQTLNVTVTDVSIGTRTVTLPDGGGSYTVGQSGGNIAVFDS